MKIEARDLQSALMQASKELKCSVIDLKYEILQNSRCGFFGIGRRNSIIEVYCKKNDVFKKEKNVKENQKSKRERESKITKEIKDEVKQELNKEKYVLEEDKIFNSFYKENTIENDENYLDEIKIKLSNLITCSGFDIELVEIKMYDENSVYIKIDGKDAALMIGKEGHRYKALSYVLHNWINLKYKLLVRLEIAEFLHNQNLAMQGYIDTIIKKVKESGKAQTKPLDGVLIKIVLEKLRFAFPKKYVGIKQINEQKIIVVNDFLKKDE